MNDNAAYALEGLFLKGKWKVLKRIDPKSSATGGFFSVCYVVSDGVNEAFLKAINFKAFFQMFSGKNVMEILAEQSNAFNFEKDLLLRCKSKNLSKVSIVLDEGEEILSGFTIGNVPYLIFEMADGDLRSKITFNNDTELAWKLRSLHNVSIGLKQLHSKSGVIQHDPWLISAHIATSTLINRFSPMLRTGEMLIKSNNFSNFDLTELASSIATFEFNEGSIKKSQEHFNLSMKSPNDNSLAQLEWIAKKDKRFEFNLSTFENIVNPFEAFALEQNEKGNWPQALVNTIKWFFDLPYSVRPVLMGSYIASTFLKNQKLAINFCMAGLKANPNDFSILNNMIYAYALDNRLAECSHYIEQFRKIKITELPDEWKVTYLATNGLIEFRTKNIESGKSLYEKSIEWALQIKNNFLIVQAYVNYAKELIANKCPEQHSIIRKIEEIKLENITKDLLILRSETLDHYYRNKLL